MSKIEHLNENEIVLRRFRNRETGEEMDFTTRWIEHEVKVPTMVRTPLFVDGEVIADAELAELGLEVVGYTQAQLDQAFYSGLYAGNPDLENRVRQYKTCLDQLGVTPAATIDEIEGALIASTVIEDKNAFRTQMTAVYDAIITNLEFCGSDTPHMDAFEQLAKLIRYLPSDQSDLSEGTPL